jgi:hypothetical protein
MELRAGIRWRKLLEARFFRRPTDKGLITVSEILGNARAHTYAADGSFLPACYIPPK